MAKIPVDIGGLRFASKGAAEDYFRSMLYRYAVGERIPDPEATELNWLLERHPEFVDKSGVGIEYFNVRSALFGTRCFEINRTDSSKTDFSFKSCVNGKAPSALSEAITALRAEVAEDILKEKRAWFKANGGTEGKVACALTGIRISQEEAHADQAPPRSFGTLAVTFLKARGIEPDSTFVTTPGDNQYQPRLADPKLAQEWKDFHHDLATIRIVAKRGNLSRSHEGKVKKRDNQLRLK